MIPPITSELGKHWTQPDHRTFLFNDTHVAITQKQLDELPEYSYTIPTGVYEGKMWKRMTTIGWVLCWYDVSDDATKCMIKTRVILLLA